MDLIFLKQSRPAWLLLRSCAELLGLVCFCWSFITCLISCPEFLLWFSFLFCSFWFSFSLYLLSYCVAMITRFCRTLSTFVLKCVVLFKLLKFRISCVGMSTLPFFNFVCSTFFYFAFLWNFLWFIARLRIGLMRWFLWLVSNLRSILALLLMLLGFKIRSMILNWWWALITRTFLTSI